MVLLTKAIREALIRNHQATCQAEGRGESVDHWPAVKLFTPWAGGTWLLTELDEAGDQLFGLCDLGLGFPELGYVSLAELEGLRGPGGLRVERDRYFEASAPLSAYAEAARVAERIVEPASG